MRSIKIKRALLAVYDKTGIADFARVLVDEFGIEIISTGGTAKHLKEAGIPVTMVEQVTGFPEMLDGRVKTLHPKIHAGILADRDKPDHMRQLAEHGIEPIDMVVVNLYPFEETVADPNSKFEDAIEMIDIGGPCMLRAAAKNHKHVLVCTGDFRYAGYETVLDDLRRWDDPQVRQAAHRRGAECAFWTTTIYDGEIQSWLSAITPGQARSERLVRLFNGRNLRYGENPHQSAQYYSFFDDSECNGLTATVGAPSDRLSFNNLIDADSAVALVKELTLAYPKKSVVAFIKHTNACGCAISDDPIEAYRLAYLGDPIAAAGGVLCMNFRVTKEIAETVMTTFPRWGKAAGAAFFKLDVWISPDFVDDEVVGVISTPTEKRKWGASCRLIDVGQVDQARSARDLDFKRIAGGMLVQQRDLLGLNEDQWKVVSKRAPSESEMADLRFAWLVCKHTKSNAITIVRDGQLLGSGAGQMSRVKSCDVAIQLARENGHGDKLAGAVAAGDAFFPVEDGPQKLLAAGITAMIHPGGGNRDADSIAVCDAAGAAMIMTGTRHFKH